MVARPLGTGKAPVDSAVCAERAGAGLIAAGGAAVAGARRGGGADGKTRQERRAQPYRSILQTEDLHHP